MIYNWSLVFLKRRKKRFFEALWNGYHFGHYFGVVSNRWKRLICKLRKWTHKSITVCDQIISFFIFSSCLERPERKSRLRISRLLTSRIQFSKCLTRSIGVFCFSVFFFVGIVWIVFNAYPCYYFHDAICSQFDHLVLWTLLFSCSNFLLCFTQILQEVKHQFFSAVRIGNFKFMTAWRTMFFFFHSYWTQISENSVIFSRKFHWIFVGNFGIFRQKLTIAWCMNAWMYKKEKKKKESKNTIQVLIWISKRFSLIHRLTWGITQ